MAGMPELVWHSKFVDSQWSVSVVGNVNVQLHVLFVHNASNVKGNLSTLHLCVDFVA
jgi:hypothetical protein